MSDIHHALLRRLDFMLLLVLTEGVRRRKLSDVARALGVTQTAISHSVARLRDLFEDDLFIRRPHGVEPTARAVALAAMAERILVGAADMLTDPAPFDPGTAERTLRIAALDYEVALLSGTIAALRATAPGLSLRFVGMSRAAACAALERDEADLWLGFARSLPTTLETTPLFEETYVVIARLGHPRLGAQDGGPVDLDAFCAEIHAVAAPSGTAGGIVDQTLRRVGRTRTVGVTTTGFLSAFDLVARSDMIATVPERLARLQAGHFGLSLRLPPVLPRPFTVGATWHRRAARDPAIRWFVDMLRGDFGTTGMVTP
jgi:DNA-binding transcriptional LysR family regulator